MLELFKSLADPTRLRLLNILQQGEFTVQELMTVLDMGQSRISRHLRILLDVCLLEVKREGTWAYYRMSPANPIFRSLLPMLLPEFAKLAEAEEDRAAVVGVLAARRERSQRFFDQHARDWDRIAQKFLPTPEYRTHLLDVLGRNNVLLEIGVGTGRLLNGLSGISDKVIGVDQAPAMLNAARQRIKDSGLENIELRLGEMEHLPLEAQVVDSAVLNMVLHHASDPSLVLGEIFRVLKSGGKLWIADLERHQDEWMREKMADQWLGFTAEELFCWSVDIGFMEYRRETIRGTKNEYKVILIGLQKP